MHHKLFEIHTKSVIAKFNKKIFIDDLSFLLEAIIKITKTFPIEPNIKVKE